MSNARRRVWEVQPNGHTWLLKERNPPLGFGTHESHAVKEVAIAAGVTVARAHAPSSLVIKRGDGTIEDERTYGDDPFPPRG